MSGAFQKSAFQNSAYQVDPDVLLGGGGAHPSQGRSPEEFWKQFPQESKTPEQVRREREVLGIIPKAQVVINEIAQRQVERLELDGQKRFEELSRELELNRIEWDSRYLEALNTQREILIREEIAKRLKAVQEEKDIIALLMIAGGIG